VTVFDSTPLRLPERFLTGLYAGIAGSTLALYGNGGLGRGAGVSRFWANAAGPATKNRAKIAVIVIRIVLWSFQVV
jgi:hypothetical protein